MKKNPLRLSDKYEKNENSRSRVTWSSHLFYRLVYCKLPGRVALFLNFQQYYLIHLGLG